MKAYCDVHDGDASVIEKAFTSMHLNDTGLVIIADIPQIHRLWLRRQENRGSPGFYEAVDAACKDIETLRQKLTSSSLSDLLNAAFARPMSQDQAIPTLVGVTMGAEMPNNLKRTILPRAVAPACHKIEEPPLHLLGRTDLAQHWSVSATFAAFYGQSVTAELGDWKELSDSAEGGTGFSYADIASDISGQLVGSALAKHASYDAMQRKLASVTDRILVPTSVLSFPDGMTEQELIKQAGSISSKRHQAMRSRMTQQFKQKFGLP